MNDPRPGSGIGNRPPERFEVRRDSRADTNSQCQWVVVDNLTGRSIRFFTSQASAFDLLRRIKANPQVAARSLEPRRTP